MRKPGTRRSISLSEEQWEALREIGEREDRSVNSVIRVALAAYIEDRRPGRAFGDLARAYGGPKLDTFGRRVAPTGAGEPESRVIPGDPQKLVSPTIEETAGVPANLKSAEPEETRPPDDEEARLLRQSFPHLKDPKIIR